MKQWHSSHSIFISRCFWDYYLHVFQKLYALELAKKHESRVTWFDPPTRNPLTWFKERKRSIDGITVRRPFSLRNEYERFRKSDRLLFNTQLRTSLHSDQKPDLWSIACAHPWLSRTDWFAKSLYWPGDYFNAKKEFVEYKNYDLVMPWSSREITNIPKKFDGIPFLSSTCAGHAFTNYDHAKPKLGFFDEHKQFKKFIIYIGGLSIDRIDFKLLEKLAKSLPDHALLMGAKHDGHDNSLRAIRKLTSLPNIYLFEDLDYARLAELTHCADVCIIPYKTSGFNAGCCPNKLFEYSAMGKFIVSTAIPSIDAYSKIISIASNADEFIQLVRQKASKKPSIQQRGKLLEMARFASPEATLVRIGRAFDLTSKKKP